MLKTSAYATVSINEAYDRVVRSDVRYRFVIDMASLTNRMP